MMMKNLNLMRNFCVIILLIALTQSDANQIPLKSIKSPDGDVFDCISIHHQPALNHPLLKEHTVQMSPSSYPEGLSGIEESTDPITQTWQLSENCPKGTIPVRRTKENGIFSGQAISKPTDFDKQEHAIGYVQVQANNTYHGAMATLNIWQPQVQNNGEFSSAQIRVIAGPLHEVNYTSIEAGWHVAPDIYGDNMTRLFVSWTKDGYNRTGCYNMMCYGFVQISNYIALGAALSPVSTYHGPQYEMTLTLWKDPVQKCWWARYQNITFGYWPTSLLPALSDGASELQWGGTVLNLKPDEKHTTTDMGSGHFIGEGVGAASYFRNIQVANETTHFGPPVAGGDPMLTYASEPTCYSILSSKKVSDGYSFVYGGPGRNPAC